MSIPQFGFGKFRLNYVRVSADVQKILFCLPNGNVSIADSIQIEFRTVKMAITFCIEHCAQHLILCFCFTGIVFGHIFVVTMYKHQNDQRIVRFIFCLVVHLAPSELYYFSYSLNLGVMLNSIITTSLSERLSWNIINTFQRATNERRQTLIRSAFIRR